MGQSTRSRVAWKYLWVEIIAIGGVISLIIQWVRTRPLWVDEEMIALNLRDRGLSDLTGLLWLNQSAPLGWLALQRVVLETIGTTERALRAVPVLFGITTVMLAFHVGKRWMGPLGAAVFVTLVSFAEFISYFPLEIKHYSADVFFGLLLPALAVWAIESGASEDGPRMRSIVTWWVAAAVAQWFSLGALLVAPACALVMCGLILRRHGRRRAAIAMLPGVILLASFAVHYQLSIHDAVGNQALQEYWWWAYPPPRSGFVGTLSWLVHRLKPLAINPGGAHLWIAFWVAAVCGIAFTVRAQRPQGLVLLAVPVSAFLFSGLRLIPLAERLTLWMLPSLYAAVALAVDEAAGTVYRSFRQRRWPGVVLGIGVAATAIFVAADIVHSGVFELSVRPQSKHGLDDKSAMRYLMAMREPEDAFVTTRMALPAVWWYGGVSIAAPNLGRAFMPDGGPILEARSRSRNDCRAENLPATLDGRKRVLVYLGFASNVPPGFPELVLDTLSQRGKLVAYRKVAEEGIAAAFDLTQEPGPWMVVVTRPGGMPLKEVKRPAGCVGFFPAERW